MKRTLLAWALAALTVSCATGEPIGRAEGEVVYGADDRLELGEATPAEQVLAQTTAALFFQGDLERGVGGWTVAAGVDDLQTAQELCPGERYAEQPTLAFCSGTLIAEDLVLTAGHCVSSSDCGSTQIAFDYVWEEGAVGRIDDEDVYSCAGIVARKAPSFIGLDEEYAILRLDRPVVGRAPATISPEGVRSLARGDALTMLGYPSGVPLKVDAGGRLQSAAPFLFFGTVDAFGGNSGSGIFHEGELVGVLLGGEQDYARDAARDCFLVNELASTAPGETMLFADVAMDGYCAEEPDDAVLCAEPDSWIAGRLPVEGGGGGCAAGGSGAGVLLAGLALVARRRRG
ncbi:MAG: serine protease [Myxococcota bacterium]